MKALTLSILVAIACCAALEAKAGKCPKGEHKVKGKCVVKK